MRPTQFEHMANLQKGHAKLMRGEYVLPDSPRGVDRMVRIDSKVALCVRSGDCRSDEQVRADWKSKQQDLLTGKGG